MREGEEAFFDVLFNDDIWKEMKRYMFLGQKSSNFYNYSSGDTAASRGYLGLMKERNDFQYSLEAIDCAAENGHIKVIKFFV